MKKIILVQVFVWLTISSFAQQHPKPDSKEYQKLKEAGKLEQPEVKEYKGNFPVLQDARRKKIKTKEEEDGALPTKTSTETSLFSTMAAAQETESVCLIEDPGSDSSYQALVANDDLASAAIKLPFSFNLFGDSFSTVYINNNGNISFLKANGTYSSTGFHNPNVNMIAPFWADVDTRGRNSGLVYYKVEPNRLSVIWDSVGYYNSKTDKLNTFKLIITDGTDPALGLGNNVAFIYGDMQWTTGGASGSETGFGGIPATVGLNKASGENDCFFYQLGRFSKEGSEYVSPYDKSGIDYLDNKCLFFDASTVEGVSLDLAYANHFCAVNFTPIVDNPQNCKIESYLWDFGDGTTSTESHPVYSFGQEGTYNVQLEIAYQCGDCSANTISVKKQVQVKAEEEMFTDIQLQVSTDSREQVLAVSAATFADSWPIEHKNSNLGEKNSFLNGAQGVWRNEGTYVYEVPRKASSSVNLSEDGSFTLESFNWEQPDLHAIPHWTQANSMTKYSPYSYELENQDVLGTYSAALYDYGGHLPAANGANMRHNEMAFTSFEYLEGTASGNWTFGTQPLPAYKILKVVSGNMNMAIVEAELEEFENVTQVDVRGKSVSGSMMDIFNRTKYTQGNEIICKQSHPTNPDLSVLVFRRAIFSGVWTGEVKIKNSVQPLATAVLEEAFGHSGSKSLKVSSLHTFQQPLLQLDSGKTYVLKAWVSVRNPHVPAPELAGGLGVDVKFRDRVGGSLLSTVSLTPSGSVIEGWQQVSGTFVCPDRKAALELSFKPGSTGTAWYDDLRLHPEMGNMKSYVYETDTYRLRAVLDEENFASFYYYDAEGNLYLVKKETVEGIKTISENVSFQVEY